MNRQIYTMFIPQTYVGVGALEKLGNIVKGHGIKRPMVITGSTIGASAAMDRVRDILCAAGVQPVEFHGCKADGPIPVIRSCIEATKAAACDAVIGLGGGSAIDTAKIVSVLAYSNQSIYDVIGKDLVQKPGIFKIFIPTTAGTGSEWSHPAILTDDRDGCKKPVFSVFTAADTAIIDPELTYDLPPAITAQTGFDALTHLIEAYVSWQANEMTDMFCEAGIKLIARSLRRAYAKGKMYLDARADMALAAALGMAAHTTATAGIAHSMNYPIALKTHMSHGEALALILPQVMEFNLIACPEKFREIARLLGENVEGYTAMAGARKSVAAVRSLIEDLRLPVGLQTVGFHEADIPDALEFLYKNQLYGMYNNPRDPSREDFTRMFRAAL